MKVSLISIYNKNVKHDPLKKLAWFIIDYFVHHLDLISLARKNFQPRNSDDETELADETYYVWDLEWSHSSFIKKPTDISSQAITRISIHKDYVDLTLLTIDASPIQYSPTEKEKIV